MTWALIAYALAQLADVATTLRGLKRGAREVNGLMAWLMQRLGGGWIVVKLLVTAGLAYLMAASGNAWGLWLVAALTATVAWRNYRLSA